MEHRNDRYDAALRRNLAEANNAILKRRALIGLHSLKSAHGLDFFTVVAHALYNDILSHSMKLFERSGQTASFWYLFKCDQAAAKSAAEVRGVAISDLEAMSEKLKPVRDQTHFHIDKDAVLNPRAIWIDAMITGDQLGHALEGVYAVMSELHFIKRGIRMALPDYDGTDAAKIVLAYKQVNPDVPIAI